MGWTPPGERRVGGPGQQQDPSSAQPGPNDDTDVMPFAVVENIGAVAVPDAHTDAPSDEVGVDLGDVFADTPVAAAEETIELGAAFADVPAPAETTDTQLADVFSDAADPVSQIVADNAVTDNAVTDNTVTENTVVNGGDTNGDGVVDLGDVFAEEAVGETSGSPDVDLGDLFGTDAPATEPAGGLGDLFGDPGTATDVEPLTAAAPVSAPPAGSETRADEPVRRPATRGKRTVRLGDAPASSSTPVEAAPVEAAPIEAAPVAGTVDPAPFARLNSAVVSYFAYERLWPTVEAVLRVVQQDAGLQSLVTRFELTRDHDLDLRQKNELIERLRPAMAVSGVNVANPDDIGGVFRAAYDELLGISVLGQLWRDDEITEIMVDSWDRIVIERDGTLALTPLKFRDPNHAASIARELARRVSGRALSQRTPLVTAELPKARVTFAVGGVVRGGLSITMRKHRSLKNLDELLALGALNRDMADFLRDCVLVRAGVLVSGGTGTGKTTIINLLSSFIPDSERVVTIEDSFELQLANTFVVAMQTKESASADDELSVTMDDLMRNSLRMRPDRIIVGEIREASAAVTMLAAATTGHDGTMTTLHAPSPSVAVNERLADMLSQSRGVAPDMARRTVTGALQLVVQVTRGRHGGRYLSEISVIDRTGIAKDGLIVPEPIFLGEEDMRGQTRFRRVGTVRTETELGSRFASRDIGRWSA